MRCVATALLGLFLCSPALAVEPSDPLRFGTTQWYQPGPGKKKVRVKQVHERVAKSVGKIVGAPIRFVAGSLKCAVNVNVALAERGVKGTGSALAKSFLKWGRPSGPVPGAVAVYDRGGGMKGHVAIVSKVVNGTVYVFNPSRRGWREIAYRKRAIAYRVASL